MYDVIIIGAGPGSRRGFNIYPAAFDNAGKKQQAGEYAGSI